MLFKLLRIDEWLSSKVSFYLFSLMFVFLCNKDLTDTKNFIFVQLSILFFICFIGASYLINDISDIEIDKKIGKKKVITEMEFSHVILILLMVMIAGIFPLFLYKRNVTCLLLSAVIYLCGFAYSLKPFRLKEKGLFGAIFCSAAQRCIPIGLIFLQFQEYHGIILIVLLNFFIGMRYILIHQLIDRKNDEKTNVSTFSRSHTKMAVAMLYLNVLLEVVMLVCTNWYIFHLGFHQIGMAFSVIFGIYVLLTLVYIKAVKYMLGERIFETFSFVPFEDFYSLFLPLMLCIAAARSNPVWLIDVAAVCIIQARMFYVRFQFVREYFKVAFRLNKKEDNFER